MLTDETGKKQPERHWIHFVYFQVKCLNFFASVVVFVAWHNVFCVSFEGEDCHNIKGYQSLKDTGKTEDSKLLFGFTLETHTQIHYEKHSFIQNDLILMSSQVSNYITSILVLLWSGKKKKCRKYPLLHPGKQLLKMTTERQQEGEAITNIHQNYRQDEAIHSRGREEKYHQYLTLFYGEATWFRPGSCAGDQQQSITIDKICVHGRPSHFVSLCSASV